MTTVIGVMLRLLGFIYLCWLTGQKIEQRRYAGAGIFAGVAVLAFAALVVDLVLTDLR